MKLTYTERTYPTLPFALVYHLARITPERAVIGLGKRTVGIHVHKDKSINSRRVEIERDEQLPIIESEVANMIAEGSFDTISLTFSTEGEEKSDLGVILERGRDPMVFVWKWEPIFGMELITDKKWQEEIDNWSGVRLAKKFLGQ